LLIDAYCGAGFFVKRLLEKFERIIGIDWDKFAIAAAMENATAKETYVVGDVDVELSRVLQIDVSRRCVSRKTRWNCGRRAGHYSHCRSSGHRSHAKTRRAIADLAPALSFIFMQSGHVGARPAEFATKFHDRLSHAVRHVSANRRIEVVVHCSCVNKKVYFFREQVRDFANDIAAKALPNLPSSVRIWRSCFSRASATFIHRLLMFFNILTQRFN